MRSGFDTTQNCATVATALKDGGIDFVARYLSKSSWKVITASEMRALTAAGLAVVLVYEDGPTAASYFSNDRGRQDGLRAAQQAALLGAPDGTAIYFAVDYDASAADLGGPITQYFRGIDTGLATSNTPRYQPGVYGSGLSCQTITGDGLATRGWLAQSTGWAGYKNYASWSIKQGMPATVQGLSVDPDVATNDYGAIPAV